MRAHARDASISRTSRLYEATIAPFAQSNVPRNSSEITGETW